MSMKILEGERFYRVCLTSKQDEISLVKKEKMDGYRYYPLGNLSGKVEQYSILECVQHTVGMPCGPIDVIPYQTYQARKVFFEVKNDKDLVGFYYDIERDMIVYGTTALYVIKRDSKYYDVITGKEVPKEVVLSLHPVISLDDMKKMKEHLKVVRYCKPFYDSITGEIFEKLKEGQANYMEAKKAYKKNYDAWLLNRDKQCPDRTEMLSKHQEILLKLRQDLEKENREIKSLIKEM